MLVSIIFAFSQPISQAFSNTASIEGGFRFPVTSVFVSLRQASVGDFTGLADTGTVGFSARTKTPLVLGVLLNLVSPTSSTF